MKNIQSIILAIATLFSLASCEKDITLDIEQTPPVTVIEGIITDQNKHQAIRVTKSTDFYAKGQPPAVTNATVTIADDAGNSYGFVYKSDTSVTGLYLSSEPFTGIVGRNYTLKVNIPSEGEYTATDLLTAGATQIGSLCLKEDPNVARFNPDDVYKYETSFTIQQPNTGSVSYWLFKFYRNDTLFGDNPFIQDGAQLRTVIEDLSGPVNYTDNDTAKFEVYSISRDLYIYYSDLTTVLNNDGGMFSPPPANPITNVKGGNGKVTGYFQCSSLISEAAAVTPARFCP